MKPFDVEAWALRVIDQVRATQRVEDSRVELKSEWLDPYIAARRIAGHANAAHGDLILWLIGVDEKRGVVGAQGQEPASWYSSVQSKFDRQASPTLVHHLQLSSDGKSVAAFLFDTSRFPYIVKNPNFGKVAGDAISLEVPWREATAIRSARHEDLVRMLAPRAANPTCEVLFAELTERNRGTTAEWALEVSLYITPRPTDLVIVTGHRMRLELVLPASRVRMIIEFGGIAGVPVMVERSGADLLFRGPAAVTLRAKATTNPNLVGQRLHLSASLRISTANSDAPLVAEIPLAPSPREPGTARWVCETDEDHPFIVH